MTLKVRQMYPDAGVEGPKSMRLDHPNWGDVRRTTYAATGVISDVKVINQTQYEPFEVQSQVKVTTGGQESDWIPLWYHPKVKYWDGLGTPPVPLATDYNEESKYFERAWMSFRVGDEAIVLLQATEDNPTLTPFAVLGFADGVARIGENLFHITAVNKIFSIIDQGLYNKTVGPDGLPLILETDCEKITDFKMEEGQGLPHYGTCVCSGGQAWAYWGAPPGDPVERWASALSGWITEWYYVPINHLFTWRMRYLVPIGPVLFVILEQTWTNFSNVSYFWYEGETAGCPPPADCNFYHWWGFDTEEEAFADAMNRLANFQQQCVGCVGPGAQPDESEKFSVSSEPEIWIYAALYNEDNLKIARNGDWSNEYNPPIPFVAQDPWFSYAVSDVIKNLAPFGDSPDQPNLDLKIKVRPHSKADMQNAGLWPIVEG